MDGTTLLGIAVGGSVLILLVLREFWAWYFKTNEMIRVMRQIRDELRKTNGAELSPEDRGLDGRIKSLFGGDKK